MNHIKQGKLTRDAALRILSQATELFKREPNVLRLDAPVVICGDIHGQFFDLATALEEGGQPGASHYLFLGDYVDRGASSFFSFLKKIIMSSIFLITILSSIGDFSTEVVFYLLAQKINNPESIHMLRGNHESRLMCEYMTFLVECIQISPNLSHISHLSRPS